MIALYTKPGCSTCDATKVWLHRNKVDYVQVDVSVDPAAAEFVDKLGYTQLPVVVAGSEHWSGFQIDRLASLKARYHSGVIGHG